MDRIEEFRFDGTFQDLIARAAIQEANHKHQEFLETGIEPALAEGNELPWMNFKIKAVVAKRKQWFSCQFRIYQEGEDWFTQVQFDSKGFSGKRFQELLDREGDLIAKTILEFATMSDGTEQET